VTEETFRRRVLACIGAGVTVGLAGCSGDGGESTADGESDGGDGTATEPPGTDGATEEPPGTDETTEENRGTGGTAEDGKQLTLSLISSSEYQSEVVTVESLTFVAASADDESQTIAVGETADISDTDLENPVTIADDLTVTYGSYEAVEMTLTPVEIIDESGSSVNVSAGTVSQSFTELMGEPATVEESGFDPSISMTLSVRDGQYEVAGFFNSGFY